MVKFNKESIQKLTKLSRIECTDDEIESLFKDLASILNYIDLLNEIDTEHVVPCHHVLAEIVNITRDDRVEESLSRDKFLKNAPDKIGGWVKVPPVIKQN